VRRALTISSLTKLSQKPFAHEAPKSEKILKRLDLRFVVYQNGFADEERYEL
jgi:hypothetical protein